MWMQSLMKRNHRSWVHFEGKPGICCKFLRGNRDYVQIFLRGNSKSCNNNQSHKEFCLQRFLLFLTLPQFALLHIRHVLGQSRKFLRSNYSFPYHFSRSQPYNYLYYSPVAICYTTYIMLSCAFYRLPFQHFYNCTASLFNPFFGM